MDHTALRNSLAYIFMLCRKEGQYRNPNYRCHTESHIPGMADIWVVKPTQTAI